MDLKKLAPWNWFKKEEEHGAVVPANRDMPSARKGRDIFDSFTALDNLERMFDSSLAGMRSTPFNMGDLLTPLTASGMLLRPQVDIGANTGEYTVSVEIPGVTEKDITLEVTGDTLIIKGEKHQEKEDKDKSYYRVERSYGSFQRMLSLPEDAEHDKTAAVFKNGVLTITIPRRKTTASPSKNIEIKALK
jgi:HSP20 family protein